VSGPDPYRWEFKARFRRHAFGWRSQPAVQRVKQAVTEIKRVARRDPLLGAEGAVTFLERVSPALEHVDSSSGAIGTAVHHAIEQLVPVVAGAAADAKTRDGWLDRLWAAHEADQMPYIESLSEHWGALCASQQVASAWADQLVDVTRMALSPDPALHGHFHGTSACMSALYAAEHYQEIVEILDVDTIWPYKRWAVRALAATGKKAEAVRYAESCRGPWTYDDEVDAMCEEMLLSSGLVDEAYSRYGLRANRRGTYLATFRAIAKKYPQRCPRALGRPRGDDAGRGGEMVRRSQGSRSLRRGARARQRRPLRPEDAQSGLSRLHREPTRLRPRCRASRPALARERVRLRDH